MNFKLIPNANKTSQVPSKKEEGRMMEQDKRPETNMTSH